MSTDDLGRKPVECVPDAANFELVPDAQVSKSEEITLVGGWHQFASSQVHLECAHVWT